MNLSIPRISFCLLLVCLIAFVSGSHAQADYTRAELIGKSGKVYEGEGIGLRKEAYESFIWMKEAAAKEGIEIRVVSGFRDFARQKGIWERKYNRFTGEGASPEEAIERIIEYSTIPGTSRHHWGTDIDIIDGGAEYSGDVLVAEKFERGGPFHKLKKWMDAHAGAYGFVRVYTDEPGRKGFKYEPWHYSYAPISIEMLKAYLQLDLKETLQEENLLGSEYLSDAFMSKYLDQNILDINKELLPR
ncbi:M15 family metallopeptidase [Robertkochia aurantiaca]|uniref:M15 family metallopeptidase n=1 Tax=Robertkochia aurantiaca TaxID=2873700 RepID=UPI001CCE2CC2|nr:M15 family metallopeptidase [Robertkochia sp. 3YJGBD-33]